jgi:hypothetical protein
MMWTEADILRGIAERLRGRPIPDDLHTLVSLQVNAGPEGYPPDHPLWHTRPRILGPGEQSSVLSEDYLSDADRADPELMAAVAAGDEVLRHGAWVAEIDGDKVIGYWLHPDEPADQPPVVLTFDTEASFDIRPGYTLVDALIYNIAGHDDDYFAEVATAFAACGLPVTTNRARDLRCRAVVVGPAALFDRIHDAERVARGLA